MEQYSRTQPGWDSNSMLPSCPRNSHIPAAVVSSENRRLNISVDLQKSSAQELATTTNNGTTAMTTTTTTNHDDHSGGRLKIKDPGAVVVKEKKRNKKRVSASVDPGQPEEGESTECGSVESQHVHTAALPLSEERTQEASGTHKVVPRIPGLGKAKAYDGPNMVKEKLQSIAVPEHNGCDIVDPDRQLPTGREDERCSPNNVFSEDGNNKKKLRRTSVASTLPRVIKRKTPVPSMILSYGETRSTSNGKTTEEEDTDYSDAFSGQRLDIQQLPVAFNDDTPFELGGGGCGSPEAGYPASTDLNPNRGLRETFVVTRDRSPWESFSPDISTGASILTPFSESQRVSESQPSNDMGE